MIDLNERLDSIESLIWEKTLLHKEMLTLGEASAYLNLSRSFMYRLTSQRRIPHYCPNGKKLFFKRQELDQWLQRNRKGSREEMESESSKYLLKNGRLF